MTKIPYKIDPEDITQVYINPLLSVKRVIVCAANRYGELIICGARHHDTIMNRLLDQLREDDVSLTNRGEQGFIDQYGQFVTRKDDCIIVLRNKQPLRDHNLKEGDDLFSENLY